MRKISRGNVTIEQALRPTYQKFELELYDADAAAIQTNEGRPLVADNDELVGGYLSKEG